jgi:hypothetical protein
MTVPLLTLADLAGATAVVMLAEPPTWLVWCPYGCRRSSLHQAFNLQDLLATWNGNGPTRTLPALRLRPTKSYLMSK